MTANNEDGSQPAAGPSKAVSTEAPPSTSDSSSSSSTPTPVVAPNRSELLDRARHFLSSPQVIHQDHESKRRFLAEKGLVDGEIQLLLREMVRLPHSPTYPPLHTPFSLFLSSSLNLTLTHQHVKQQPSQLPVVPPRMYPAPPPSRLPGLLVGTFKLLSWLTGGSTVLLFIYYVRTYPSPSTLPLAETRPITLTC